MNLGHFMPGNIWVSIAGYALVVLGYLDALKYHTRPTLNELGQLLNVLTFGYI